jgi:hypothetical protein
MSVYLQPRNPVGNLRKLEFPYVPQIDYSNDVKYDAYNLVHTNYQPYAYSKTENPQINLQAKFSAHTTEHFKLSEFALRFLRTYTKMNYGREDDRRGQPPRILRFYAHGTQIFHNIPVVISKFGVTFPEDVDYYKGIFDSSSKVTKTEEVDSKRIATNSEPKMSAESVPPTVVNGEPQNSILYLPAIFTINISLLVQQNIYKTVNQFTLENFAQGKLYKDGYI